MRSGIPITIETTLDSDELLIRIIQSRGLDKCIEVMMKYYQKPLTDDHLMSILDKRDEIVEMIKGE